MSGYKFSPAKHHGEHQTSMRLETFTLDKSPVKFTQFFFKKNIFSISFILITFPFYLGLG